MEQEQRETKGFCAFQGVVQEDEIVRKSFMRVPLMHARSARDPFPDRISESFRANYLKFGVVSGREDNECAGVFRMRGEGFMHAATRVSL